MPETRKELTSQRYSAGLLWSDTTPAPLFPTPDPTDPLQYQEAIVVRFCLNAVLVLFFKGKEPEEVTLFARDPFISKDGYIFLSAGGPSFLIIPSETFKADGDVDNCCNYIFYNFNIFQTFLLILIK